MTFDPKTIEHLGVRMYSTLPPVLSELIANSYDANAGEVHILLNDSKKEAKEIVVEDNGTGMSLTDINEKFLRIGRNRRLEERTQTTSEGRKVIGKKGLGKLSFFGIAQEIEVATRENGKENIFILCWEDIMKEDHEYKPKIIIKDGVYNPKEHGTRITLRGIKRTSDFSAEDLAVSLSRIFIIDPKFKIFIRHNADNEILVENDKKFEGLDKEVEWHVPADLQLKSDYEKKDEVKGYLMTSKKPIPPQTNMRGVTLFSRGKLVNTPEYFSDSTSSHFFSYLTGSLEVDFIDDLEEDVIATDRQSLNWGHPDMYKLREYFRSMMNWLERDWRKKREEAREKELDQKTGINVKDWLSKLPTDMKNLAEPILNALEKDSELPIETTSAVVRSLHEIVPEYPRYHWRHLHSEIQNIAKEDYINKRYFDAAEKASRLYIQRVKEKSTIDTGNDSGDMDAAFNVGDGKLMVTACDDSTKKNIQIGQSLLSKGIVSGCRNPLTHNPEYTKKLVETGLFTEKDCLDMLSMISHLFSRLEKAHLRS